MAVNGVVSSAQWDISALLDPRTSRGKYQQIHRPINNCS
jgi:hypothetical protein